MYIRLVAKGRRRRGEMKDKEEGEPRGEKNTFFFFKVKKINRCTQKKKRVSLERKWKGEKWKPPESWIKCAERGWNELQIDVSDSHEFSIKQTSHEDFLIIFF